MSERIVVLGGGMLGVCSAVHLGDALGARHRVTLMDERDQHIFYPNNLWVMTGARTRAQSTRPLARLAKHNVEVVRDRVEGIDPRAGTVQLARAGRVAYDRLIIGLGLQTHAGAVPGAADVNHPWELDAAERFGAEVGRFQGGRFVFGISGTPYRCPPAPYETCWLLDDEFRKRGIRGRVQMTFFSPEPAAFGGGNKTVSGWAMNRMAMRGIEMHWGFEPVEVDQGRRIVRSKDGRELEFDLLGMVPVHRPAQPLLDSGLAGAAGVEVDLERLTTEWPNVYAGGDCSAVPISKAGGQAHVHAEVISHNLVAELDVHDGRLQARRYKPHSI